MEWHTVGLENKLFCALIRWCQQKSTMTLLHLPYPIRTTWKSRLKKKKEKTKKQQNIEAGAKAAGVAALAVVGGALAVVFVSRSRYCQKAHIEQED